MQDLLMGRLALDLLELLEVILQTYLIQDCFRRCSEEEFQRNAKPVVYLKVDNILKEEDEEGGRDFLSLSFTSDESLDVSARMGTL
ncbi:unnamed protein product [Dibothriocephalus latus]|uniref:Uncharacterized protein n=1 Tax=Dibothriocephalus latus TaxID=60516 RepID=A0A3P7RKH1_DIBLA|nr:unnamed protein product [Dibothriocephalus latus]